MQRNYRGAYVTGFEDSVPVAVCLAGSRLEVKYYGDSDRIVLGIGAVAVPMLLEQARNLHALLGAGIEDATTAHRIDGGEC